MSGTERDDPVPQTPSGPAPIGSLGKALVDVQGRVQTITIIVTAVVAIALVANLLPLLGVPLAERIGLAPTIWTLGVIAWGVFVLAVVAIALLPPLLLPRRDRAVLAAHSWIGAREIRRVVGRAGRAMSLPRDARTAEQWLSRTPATDTNRVVRVDALILLGRFEEAGRELELLPESTPLRPTGSWRPGR